ncbi:MAG: PilZ domain-containing protein [Candidatus Eisenbacteria bacterium]|nr:PilZ domain-containing protein [Candidatus Eisenbacteria bacterium]
MKKTSARSGRERRGSERADAKLTMRVEAGIAAGAPQLVTESQNISSSGIYCHASHYLAPLSKVQLTIVLPALPGRGEGQELVKCEGIVVRCSQRSGDTSGTPYELACMFSGLDRELRGRIEEFVTWRNLQALRAALAPEKPSPKRKPMPKSAPVAKAAVKKVAKKVGKKAAKKAAKKIAKKTAKKAVKTSAKPVVKKAAKKKAAPKKKPAARSKKKKAAGKTNR